MVINYISIFTFFDLQKACVRLLPRSLPDRELSDRPRDVAQAGYQQGAQGTEGIRVNVD